MQPRQAHFVASTYAGFVRVRQPTKQISYTAKAAKDPPPEPHKRYNAHPRPRSFNRLPLSKPDRSSQRSAKSPLFEELFPDEAEEKASQKAQRDDIDQTLLPLSLRTDERLLEGRGKQTFDEVPYVKEATKIASSDAYKHRKTAVLVLQCASKSLIESDFRRIAPRGMHIRDWAGPGDIRTVFPARDPNTFEQTDHYFIVFSNPAYARAYQSHVHRLYRMARQHTPKSVDSPLPLQRGVKINPEDPEDANAMLQDFTLCPPSHRLKLLYHYEILSPGMCSLLDRGGYLRLPDDTDRAGRAVLFWVDGYSPTMREINTLIATDGRDRGMAWDISISKVQGSTEIVDSSEYLPLEGSLEEYESQPPRRAFQRWVLTFAEESEARSFARSWHRRPLASITHDDSRTVHAEVIW